jgi:hypothetical protein
MDHNLYVQQGEILRGGRFYFVQGANFPGRVGKGKAPLRHLVDDHDDREIGMCRLKLLRIFSLYKLL